MGKKNRKQKSIGSKKHPQPNEQPREVAEEMKVTWEDIVAMSDSDDDRQDIGVAVDLSAQAKSLRQTIKDGKFNILLQSSQGGKDGKDEDEDDEFEEDVLDGSESSDEEEENDDDNNSDDNDVDIVEDEGVGTVSNTKEDEEVGSDDDDESQSSDGELDGNDRNKSPGATKTVERDEDTDINDSSEGEDHQQSGGEEDNQQDEDEEDSNAISNRNHPEKTTNSKALAVVTAELAASHSRLPWAETFVVVPTKPLPFGENGDPESNPLDIHDDLKREVAFYNAALDAVHQARSLCKQANIPFTRPDDFFAEMVKTDDHMAKIKDRLIFETKKIEAVAQRKSNKEQKLRAKESHANRLAEKAKRKREHFQQVEDWANSVAKQRGKAIQDNMEENFLGDRNKKGPNKKRQAADRKFGFGGKRGRFKQNDRESMNDMSGFNHRGNFAGGMKRVSSSSKSGSGANRPGKRARDSKRARR